MSGNKSCPAYPFCPDAIKINCTGCGFENIDFFGDIENVVRCKDCKYGRRVLDQDDSFGLMCEKGNKNNYRFDWFCANGERKDNG